MPIWSELERIPRPPNATVGSPNPLQTNTAPIGTGVRLSQKRATTARSIAAVGALVALTGVVVLVFYPSGMFLLIAGALGAVGAGTWWWNLTRRSEYGAERHRRSAALRRAQERHQERTAELEKTVSGFAKRYSSTRSRLEEIKANYLQLRGRYDTDVAGLERTKEEAQRREYLKNELLEEPAFFERRKNGRLHRVSCRQAIVDSQRTTSQSVAEP